MLRRSDILLGLSGELWPLHLKPLPDELLSSWLIRLAHSHGMKLQTFCSIAFGNDKALWNRDIDKLAPDWLIAKLAESTGASLQAVLNTTLKSYEGVLYEHHQPHGNTKWILPLGIYHRARHGHGLQYCPRCLEQDAEPYFRKRWRLAFSTLCTTHGCYLLDACPSCQSPLAPHRADMHGREYFPYGALNVLCWKCGFDLRSAPVIDAKNNFWARPQAQLEFALEHRYIGWASNPAMYSVVFFEGLRELIAGITSRPTRERLERSELLHGAELGDWPREQLEMTPQSLRRVLFHALALVLEEWPVKFSWLIHECKLRYADLKGDSEHLVYWYEDVILREAGGGYAAISTEETDSIVSAVIARDGRFSQGRARRLSGRDIAAHLQDRKVRHVSDDVYEELLTSIDHQIAGTLDKTERACLIRDKVMFATGRLLGLSEGSLSELTLDHVRRIVSEIAELSFVDAAKTPTQARAWVEWYWVRIRPQLRPRPNDIYVFTSSHTRRRLQHSAIGNRFKQLVNSALLSRAIPNYSCWPCINRSV